jgi:hypothetical protein
MLKIKDDVNLKELKRFGFIKCPQWRWEDYIYADKNYKFEKNNLDCEDFYIKERHIVVESEWYGNKVEWLCDVLFDLIQAGLVEKVEE